MTKQEKHESAESVKPSLRYQRYQAFSQFEQESFAECRRIEEQWFRASQTLSESERVRLRPYIEKNMADGMSVLVAFLSAPPWRYLPRPEYVYMMRCGNSVKVGMTKNPEHRLKTLRNEQKADVRLLALLTGGRHIERQLHSLLLPFNTKGEWFSADSAVLVAADIIRETGHLPEKSDLIGPRVRPAVVKTEE